MTFTLPSSRAARAPGSATATPERIFPSWGWFGLVTMLVSWVLNWLPTHPLSGLGFFTLWFGFILTLDGVNFWRRGASILSAHPWKFAQLFAFSIPFWWLFEAFNARVQNWQYHLDHPFGLTWGPVSYNLMATLCFSTVLPVVMEMTALFTTLPALRPRMARGTPEPLVPRGTLIAEFVGGIVAIVLPLIWPHYAFGLIWVGPMLLLDATNAALRRRSAIGHLVAGDWRFVAALALATLACGFFWEMWNFWSLPKWSYTIPFVGFAKVFEMPILGFLGYLPFGVELFALYQFLLWATRQRDDALPF
jgi:hypothetical protein